MLTHGFWQRRFAGDPEVIGRALTLDGAAATVVGVVPAGFEFSSLFAPGTEVDLMLPLVYDVARRQGNTLAVIGRLQPGRTLSQVRTELEAVTAQVQQERPERGRFYGAAAVELKDQISSGAAGALLTLWAAVAGVLLIVCANLSSLMLSRAAARWKSICRSGEPTGARRTS
ncbi:MAG: ABC transporter permease [Vicinamibacterales bacterium]|mgnify:CR=1 FL=1|nr:ABC transporter permease [Vicinamibacterales bacterium]MDP7471573.1 ABC transporter permease [Vicinamibacterales bacterium]MDP7672583.1 ABC transporter permease [Vicinamibacterales bacterium]HJO39388.1 ABC transporter permease [Vicinamibacterales bacterium]